MAVIFCVCRRCTSMIRLLQNVHMGNSQIYPQPTQTQMQKNGGDDSGARYLLFTLHAECKDPLDQYLIQVYNINSTLYNLVRLYLPKTHQLRFFQGFIKKIHAFQKGSLLICGDFNLTPDPMMDITTTTRRPQSSLQSFLQSNPLYDVSCCYYVNEKYFTFFSVSHRSYSRIYLFLLDKWHPKKNKSADNKTITWSDHAPVMLGNSYPVGSIYIWRSNPWLLQDANTRPILEQHLTEFLNTNVGSVSNPFVL